MTYDINKIFGLNLKKWRQIRGLSQEQLAEKLNLHFRSISRFERGEHFCKAKTIGDLANALEIKPSDLFEIENPDEDCKNLESLKD